MIPALLLADATAVLSAVTSGSNTGFGDGTAYNQMPGASFGNLNISPPEIFNDNGTVAYIYTASGDLTLMVKEDPGYTFDDGNSLVVGADTYAFSASTENGISGGGGSYRRWVWSGATALVDSTEYNVSIA